VQRPYLEIKGMNVRKIYVCTKFKLIFATAVIKFLARGGQIRKTKCLQGTF